MQNFGINRCYATDLGRDSGDSKLSRYSRVYVENFYG